LPLHGHELVHAVLLAQGLTGTAALQEGAAEVFGKPYRHARPIPHSLRLGDLVDAEAFREESSGGYPSAASFVSFLLDRGGEARFFTLMSRTHSDVSLASLDATTLDIYGATMTDLHAEWGALPEEPGYMVSRPIYPCGAAPIEAPGLMIFDRGVAETFGRAGAVRTFSVARPGVLRVRMTGAPSPEVTVLSCDRGGPGLDEGAIDSNELDVSAPVEPGNYAIWMSATLLRGADASIEVDVSLTIE
jgi:hypothetical protein